MNRQIHYRLEIEKYVTGELDSKRSESLVRHMKQCSECDAYAAELKREKQKFLNVYPYTEFVKEKAQNKRSLSFKLPIGKLLRPVLVPVSLLLLLFAVSVPFLGMFYKSNGIDVTYKGKAALSFAVNRNGKVHRGVSSEKLFEGDRVQIIYSSDKKQYLTLISIDSKGNVSFYYPGENDNECSIKTDAGKELTYPGSIVLDAVYGYELVVAFFSKEPLQKNVVRMWAQNMVSKKKNPQYIQSIAENELPDNVKSYRTLLLKKG